MFYLDRLSGFDCFCELQCRDYGLPSIACNTFAIRIFRACICRNFQTANSDDSRCKDSKIRVASAVFYCAQICSFSKPSNYLSGLRPHWLSSCGWYGNSAVSRTMVAGVVGLEVLQILTCCGRHFLPKACERLYRRSTIEAVNKLLWNHRLPSVRRDSRSRGAAHSGVHVHCEAFAFQETHGAINALSVLHDVFEFMPFRPRHLEKRVAHIQKFIGKHCDEMLLLHCFENTI